MKMMVVICFILLLSGCAEMPRVNPYDQEAVSKGVVIEHDDVNKITKFTGPNGADNKFKTLYIRAWKIDGVDKIDYQIYVKDYYTGGWRFYNSSWDSKGTQFTTIIIGRDTDCIRYGCAYYETLGLNVTREYLEKSLDSGISFQISGKGGKEVFTIPAEYIKAFLAVAK